MRWPAPRLASGCHGIHPGAQKRRHWRSWGRDDSVAASGSPEGRGHLFPAALAWIADRTFSFSLDSIFSWLSFFFLRHFFFATFFLCNTNTYSVIIYFPSIYAFICNEFLFLFPSVTRAAFPYGNLLTCIIFSHSSSSLPPLPPTLTQSLTRLVHMRHASLWSYPTFPSFYSSFTSLVLHYHLFFILLIHLVFSSSSFIIYTLSFLSSFAYVPITVQFCPSFLLFSLLPNDSQFFYSRFPYSLFHTFAPVPSFPSSSSSCLSSSFSCLFLSPSSLPPSFCLLSSLPH